jgi:penicillin-insensitive murein endopeptidase
VRSVTVTAIVLFVGLFAGCLPWKGLLGEGGSIGHTSRGLLGEPEHLPRSSDNFRFYRAYDRRYGTPELVGLVRRTADRVAAEHPGSTLLVGDMSGPRGGFISEHGSHRNGRDVDLAFFATDPAGRERRGTPLVRFDRFGVGVRKRAAVRFDSARNWAVVESLLGDDGAEVQWVFVSRGLKALLLEWAVHHRRPVETVERAVKVLHQPTDGMAHDDHFHVRIYCPRDPPDHLCRDRGPVWPWIDRQRSSPVDGLTDQELLDIALDGLS